MNEKETVITDILITIGKRLVGDDNLHTPINDLCNMHGVVLCIVKSIQIDRVVHALFDRISPFKVSFDDFPYVNKSMSIADNISNMAPYITRELL